MITEKLYADTVRNCKCYGKLQSYEHQLDAAIPPSFKSVLILSKNCPRSVNTPNNKTHLSRDISSPNFLSSFTSTDTLLTYYA